jgi:pimeloyl-ACP methyl ester carboxylesterase
MLGLGIMGSAMSANLLRSGYQVFGFDVVADRLQAFAQAGYRFVAYDRRGHGRTEVDPKLPQTATAADDLQFLTNSMGFDAFHLVGSAAGGIVAIDFALSFPERLRSLVVANSIGGLQDEPYLALMRRLRPSPLFDALPAEVRELGPSFRAADPEGVRRWSELERASRAPGTKTMPGTRSRITFAALETLKAPALLLTGDADLYIPPPVLNLLAERIPNCQSLVVPGCGHSAYWEQPALFNQAVLAFIDNH